MKYGTRKKMIKLSAVQAPETTRHSEVDGEGKSVFGRAIQGLSGTGTAISNFRTGMTMASPNTTLYHGTNPNSAAAILGAGPDPSVTGLDTRFAGFADRLNSKMLANAVNTQLMDAGLNPSDDLLERVTDSARKEMASARAQGIQGFDSVAAIERGARKELLSEGMDPAKVDDILNKVRPNLSNSGKRIYLAQTPAVVGLYGTEENELGMMQRAFRKLQKDPLTPLKSTANVLTGGVLPEVTQSAKKFQYDRAVKGVGSDIAGTSDAQKLMSALRDKDLNVIDQEIRRLNPSLTEDAIAKIKDRASKGTLGVSFGVRAKRNNIKSLSDFPFVSGLLSLNPGLKHETAKYVPTFDPVNDLSVPESIPLQDFRNIDLLDTSDSTPLLRLNMPKSKSTAVTAGERLIGMKKGLPFLAIGGIGADMAQDAVFQKGLLSKRALTAGKNRLTSMFPRSQEKQAAIVRESTLQGLREAGKLLNHIAVPTVALGGTGAAAAHGYGKASDSLEKKLMSPEIIQLKEEERQRLIASGKDPRTAETLANAFAKKTILSVVSTPAGILGGVIAAGVANPRRVARAFKGTATVRDAAGAGATAYAGISAIPLMMSRSEDIKGGADVSDQSPLYAPLRGTKTEKWFRENPEYSGLLDIAPAAALPALAAYAGRKYYSGDYAKALNIVRKNFYSDVPLSDLLSKRVSRADPGSASNYPLVLRSKR